VSKSSAVGQRRQIVMVKCPLHFSKRQLQLDMRLVSLGRRRRVKQGWQHWMMAGGVGEPSP
jgi:hypothetical protein